MTLGPTLLSELIAAGVNGLPFSWGRDGTIYDQGLTPAQLTAVQAVFAAHNPTKTLPPVISSEAFIGLFSALEQAALLGSTDANIRLWVTKAMAAGAVNLGDPLVKQGLDYAVSVSLLTAGRETTILAYQPT
jgi:hypothetical protein